MLLRNRLLEFRHLFGFTVDQLAERAGVSTWTVNHLESDPGYTPQARVMLRLCATFRCELGRLFYIDWEAPDPDPEREIDQEDSLAGVR